MIIQRRILNMNLFEDKKKEDNIPSNIIKTIYHSLVFSTNESEKKIKDCLNNWFSHLPEEEKGGLKNRFIRDDFYSAFFELFLHEFFYKLGFKITFHPTIEGMNTHPDFLLEKNNFKFYLEATLCKEYSEEKEKEIKRKEAFCNEINKLVSSDFFISPESINIPDENQPSSKDLKRFIEKKLNELDKEQLEKEFKNLDLSKYMEKYRINYKKNGVELSMIPIPKESKSNINELLATDTFVAEDSRFEVSFRNTLKKKGKRYGDMKLPFVIAVDILESGVSKEDIIDALFGETQYVVGRSTNKIEISRKKDGFFLNKQGPQNTMVSGVLTVPLFHTDLEDKRLISKKIKFFHNPWAKNPFLKDYLPMCEYFVERGEIKEKNTDFSIYDILFL